MSFNSSASTTATAIGFCGVVVTATGTIALNEELDDFKHVALERCRVWPGGTGLALRDWLRTRGHEPQSFELP